MGDVNRFLITGASGFIGRATVRAAVRAGVKVIAVQRGRDPEMTDVTQVSIDLTEGAALPALTEALKGCDGVIHLAASMSNDAEAHRRLTIGGTERVLEAMRQAKVRHLTLASSIAVFDTSQVPVGADLTDACPLENPAMSRDIYSGAKVRQENLARAARLPSLAIVRPGIVHDVAHLWNAHLGVGLGPILLRLGGEDRLPMCHVDRCAAAMVNATLRKADETCAVLDPELPTRGEVIAALRQTGWPRLVIPLPWQLPLLLARLLRPVSSRMPGLLREDVVRQRVVPIGYDLGQSDMISELPCTQPILGAAT